MVRLTTFRRSETRPPWVRPAYNNYAPPIGYAPWSEFAPDDDDTKYIVEYVRSGSRGKDRFILMFERGEDGQV